MGYLFMNNTCASTVRDNGSVFVSVIVPVYKVEQYLERCLDSLIAQDFLNVEFLLIDDGSPDSCGSICESYSKRDPRFRVFHKENGGLSSARNFGIERARGDYLMFLDSDDWVRSDFCSTAYNLANKNDSDLVMFCHQVVSDVYTQIKEKADLKSGFKSSEEGIDLLLEHVGVYAWNKMYKSSLFEGIRYPEGRLFEDQPVTWQLVYKAKNIYFTNEILYYYFMRTGSIVHQETYKAAKDKFEMRMQFYDGIKEKGYSKERIAGLLSNAALSFAMRVKTNPNDLVSRRVNDILMSYRSIPKDLMWQQRILMFIYLRNTHLFDICCELIGKRIHVAHVA